MTNLRKSILLILILLAFVFNLERLDIIEENVVNIQSFVYPLIFVAVVSTLIVPFLWHSSVGLSLALWTGVYILLRILVFTSRPLLGGLNTHLTITELALLVVSILLSCELARRIDEYETLIAKVALPHVSRKVYPWEDASEEVKSMFAGSRRHNRPLSILLVEPAKATLKPELQRVLLDLQKLMLTRFISASLAQLIAKEARRTDIIVEKEDKNSFLVLCPETNPDGSISFGKRIQVIAKEKLGVQVCYGSASFPEDALTFDDLLQKARFDLVDPSQITFPTYDQAATTDDTK
jgi:hypothetical protein